jgi:hypothetical protein
VFAHFNIVCAFAPGAGLDVFDRVPTDLEVLGHVFDGQVPGQFQDLAFKGPGVTILGVREGKFDLQYLATGEAMHAWHLEL